MHHILYIYEVTVRKYMFIVFDTVISKTTYLSMLIMRDV